ncbi:MAG: family 16 glycosylhydrolase [Alphaproteobacteria bacterium]|nr:family 16 glycosylhydrolase [Alphaproteobacteria bacterium]
MIRKKRWRPFAVFALLTVMSVLGAGANLLSLGGGEVALADPLPAPQPNTGRTPDAGFLTDLRQGLDRQRHYRADYVMYAEWLGTGYKPGNIRFNATGMTLNLERKKIGRHRYTGAEFQQKGFFGYGRYEVVMRAPRESGSIASFFTHTGPGFGDPHHEIDFEFLGRNPRQVHVNYFSGDPVGSLPVELGFDASAADHLYAFEWSPGSIRWFVDGRLVHSAVDEGAKIPVPTASSRVIANIWAPAGSALQWAGVPRFRKAAASYRCISHVPLGQTGSQCSDLFPLK